MRLKHYLYAVTLICAVAEIGMALYAMHWGEVIRHISWTEQKDPESEMLIVQALNIALPVGVCCIGLLIWTWKVDAIGGFALFMAAVLHLVGLDLNLRAVKKIYGNGTPLASVTWWAPEEKNQQSAPLPDGPSS
jgi:hypothetical protein